MAVLRDGFQPLIFSSGREACQPNTVHAVTTSHTGIAGCNSRVICTQIVNTVVIRDWISEDVQQKESVTVPRTSVPAQA